MKFFEHGYRFQKHSTNSKQLHLEFIDFPIQLHLRSCSQSLINLTLEKIHR